jgi:hypothetical protein
MADGNALLYDAGRPRGDAGSNPDGGRQQQYGQQGVATVPLPARGGYDPEEHDGDEGNGYVDPSRTVGAVLNRPDDQSGVGSPQWVSVNHPVPAPTPASHVNYPLAAGGNDEGPIVAAYLESPGHAQLYPDDPSTAAVRMQMIKLQEALRQRDAQVASLRAAVMERAVSMEALLRAHDLDGTERGVEVERLEAALAEAAANNVKADVQLEAAQKRAAVMEERLAHAQARAEVAEDAARTATARLETSLAAQASALDQLSDRVSHVRIRAQHIADRTASSAARRSPRYGGHHHDYSQHITSGVDASPSYGSPINRQALFASPQVHRRIQQQQQQQQPLRDFGGGVDGVFPTGGINNAAHPFAHSSQYSHDHHPPSHHQPPQLSRSEHAELQALRAALAESERQRLVAEGARIVAAASAANNNGGVNNSKTLPGDAVGTNTNASFGTATASAPAPVSSAGPLGGSGSSGSYSQQQQQQPRPQSDLPRAASVSTTGAGDGGASNATADAAALTARLAEVDAELTRCRRDLDEARTGRARANAALEETAHHVEELRAALGSNVASTVPLSPTVSKSFSGVFDPPTSSADFGVATRITGAPSPSAAVAVKPRSAFDGQRPLDARSSTS